jgi:hypothetical protein
MVTTTAQLLALACHFNGWVRGLRVDAFFPSNSTAKFCEYIRFVRFRRRWFAKEAEWMIAAQSPDEWLAREARSKRRAILRHQRIDNGRMSDRLSAGWVGGGGRWQLCLASAGRADVWEPKWEVGNRQAAERRIWRVTYALVAEDADAVPATHEAPDEIIPALSRTLSEMLEFCGEHNLDSFAKCFRNASECLVASDPSALVYHQDLAPDGLLSLPAKQVLAACQAAWVFGGMGSWNDLGFEGQEQSRYQGLSDELFALLNTAIAAAANSTAA